MAMAMMQPPVDPELATKQDVRAVDEKVDRLDEKVDRLDEKVDRLESRFDRLEAKVDAILQVMREHMASKADVEHMGRIVTIWMVGAMMALMGIVLTVVSNLTNAVLQLAK